MDGWMAFIYTFCASLYTSGFTGVQLMRQKDEDAPHELNIKMGSLMDNVAEINHVHEEDKVIKIIFSNLAEISKMHASCRNSQ